jgi:RNA polymerase sigma-70 factor (ECF subfamily)
LKASRDGPAAGGAGAPGKAAPADADWFDVLERLDSGDRLAYMQISRLVAGVLRGLRAYDFHDDWADVIQDVAISLVKTFREGRLGRDDAVGAYVRQMTRNRFRDRLRTYVRRHERDTVDIDAPPDESPAPTPSSVSPDPASALDLRRALERLTEEQRGLVLAVYGERCTYEEAAERVGMPLGSAKRHLAEGLRRLRARLGPEAEEPGG